MKTSARVLKGASLLDAYFRMGAWRDDIDIDKLVMDDPFNCILGQLFNDYTSGLYALHLTDMNTFGVSPRFEAGFSTAGWDGEDWTRLEWEWIYYLKGQTDDDADSD